MADDASLTPAGKSDGHKLHSWADRLSAQNIPIFGKTALELCHAVAQSKVSASELARIILRDPAMTSQVLRVANSAYYARGSFEMTTITRAVVVLGFDQVRSIGLSVAVVDKLLAGNKIDRVQNVLASSFAASILAKAIANLRGDTQPEEIFIAALLYRIGAMAFWCHGGQEADELDQALNSKPDAEEATELLVLGIALRDLSAELVKRWQLGQLVSDALRGKGGMRNQRSRAVVLGHALQRALVKGLNHPDVAVVLGYVADYTTVPIERAQEMAQEALKEAAQTAASFGVGLADSILPPDELPEEHAHNQEIEASAKPSTTNSDFPDANPLLQLQILREVSMLITGRPSISVVLNIMLEGIYRGVGLDRALVTVLTPDRSRLQVKQMVGKFDTDLAERFHFRLNDPGYQMFKYALERQSPMLLDPNKLTPIRDLVTPQIRHLLANGPFVIAPIVVEGKDIGLFYADRQMSGRPIDREAFESFKHFVHHTSLSLDYLKRMGATDGGESSAATPSPSTNRPNDPWLAAARGR
jgi:HD-like signal output (HDOD) protein